MSRYSDIQKLKKLYLSYSSAAAETEDPVLRSELLQMAADTKRDWKNAEEDFENEEDEDWEDDDG